jgi:ectoine hydroxylase-related dioxygenase (phytanoyl-CoA dioxygenase family)
MGNIYNQIKSKHFNDYGYEIIRSSLNTEYLSFESLMAQYFSEELSKYLSKELILDNMSNYNELAKNNNLDHHGFISSISRKLPLKFQETEFVKKIINHSEDFIERKVKIVDNLVWFRICRPGFDDSNDLHRDHWFPNYNDVLNLYVPISGSYCDSSMKIVPKSYKWSDKDVIPTFSGDSGLKYIKNGVHYSAPGIKYSEFEIIPHRPDIATGDFMIFHPKSIHGGGDNYSDETRISLEIRIEL